MSFGNRTIFLSNDKNGINCIVMSATLLIGGYTERLKNIKKIIYKYYYSKKKNTHTRKRI